MTIVKERPDISWKIRMNIPLIKWVRSRVTNGAGLGEVQGAANNCLEAIKFTFHQSSSSECSERWHRRFPDRRLPASSPRSELSGQLRWSRHVEAGPSANLSL